MTVEEQGQKEEFCILNGWKKVHGIKINVEALENLNDSYDYMYFDDNSKQEIVEECYFWQDSDGTDENVFEEIDELIEHIENYHEASFEEFQKQRSSSRE